VYWTAEREGSGEGLEVELAEHAELTLTGLYNVLEKLRRDEPLPAKDKLIHERGLVAVMRSLHDELDAVVLDAYGWNDKPDDAALLERLVALTPLPRKRKEQSAGCAPIFKIPNLPKRQWRGWRYSGRRFVIAMRRSEYLQPRPLRHQKLHHNNGRKPCQNKSPLSQAN